MIYQIVVHQLILTAVHLAVVDVEAAAVVVVEIRFEDKVGIGWRSELAYSIISNLNEIDYVEVIIENFLDQPKYKIELLKTITQQVPVIYHGVSLGLATSYDIEQKRIDKLARFFEIINAQSWSEHLAFVRVKNIEMGHLCAPPRSLDTIQGTVKNISRVIKTIGIAPNLENIATLIHPPGSTISEPVWISEILNLSNTNLLLDLHNLYSNAVNFGYDPFAYLLQFSIDRVRQVHLSGGRWVPEPIITSVQKTKMRMLDDHCHDIPNIVFELLYKLILISPNNLNITIERDGNYPDFAIILNQIKQIKKIIKSARRNQFKKCETRNYECTEF